MNDEVSIIQRLCKSIKLIIKDRSPKVVNDKITVVRQLCELIELVAQDTNIPLTNYNDENGVITYKIIIDKTKSNDKETEE